jgi:hypothetical protein
MKMLLVTMILVFLVGCTGKTQVVTQETPMIHPERPVAVERPDIKFTTLVIDVDGSKTPYVALERDKAADLSNWLESIHAFIKKQNNMLCFYRKDLKEKACD